MGAPGVQASSAIHNRSPLDSLFSHQPRQQPFPLGRTELTVRQDPDPRGPGRPPSSPLLHTRFRHSPNDSMASHATTSNSFMDMSRDTMGSGASTVDMPWSRGRAYDPDSWYSEMSEKSHLSYSHPYDTPAFAYIEPHIESDGSSSIPASPTPSSPGIVIHPADDGPSYAVDAGDGRAKSLRPDAYPTDRYSAATVADARDTWVSSADPFSFREYESHRSMNVPHVVVSSPVPSEAEDRDWSWQSPPQQHQQRSGAVPSKVSYTSMRPTAFYDEQAKREVLQRNRPSGGPAPVGLPRSPRASTSRDDQHTGPQSFPTPQSMSSSPQQHSRTAYYPVPSAPPAPLSRSSSPYDTSRASSPSAMDSLSPKSNDSYAPPGSGRPQGSYPGLNRSTSADGPSRPSYSPNPTFSRSVSANAAAPSIYSSTTHIRLPAGPPSPRPISRVSLYSNYSYYPVGDESQTSSPASPQFPDASRVDSQTSSPTVTSTGPPRRKGGAAVGNANPSNPQSPDDFLQLGITHHEANRLEESAECFKQSAMLHGGTGVGMLMWGLSLRHAWGTKKDEKAAFRWLRKAAEAAVDDLEGAREGQEQKAVKTELVLAIYEVGQCFFHGWGVPPDKKMAVSYFQVAARLGDADAQQELGFCFANGKGCKKDIKEAARWYRAAAAQGMSTVGLAWIYKPKNQ